MIKNIENVDNLKIDVLLKTGHMVKGADVTSSPFGDHERVVCWWEGDKVTIVPIADVERVWMYEADK